MRFKALSFLLILLSIYSNAQNASKLNGAWQGDQGIFIFADNYYSYAAFTEDAFLGTHGGIFEVKDNKIQRTLEFNTFEPATVGNSFSESLKMDGSQLTIDGKKFKRIDNGKPGALQGAYLFSGRKQDDGSISERTPGPRKTMKILSGTRFQWIAYNTETKEFMGTGGGTYTSKDGKYTETIDFFSRDQTRVGAVLPFDFNLVGDKWHHSGNNSRGEPMYEVWKKRE